MNDSMSQEEFAKISQMFAEKMAQKMKDFDRDLKAGDPDAIRQLRDGLASALTSPFPEARDMALEVLSDAIEYKITHT